MYNRIEFALESPGTPVARRALGTLTRIARERAPAASSVSRPLHVRLRVTAQSSPDTFRITDTAPDTVCVECGSDAALFYGGGKLLRLCRFHDDRILLDPWRGASSPEKTVRGMYFATHFHNYYHDAPVEEIVRYVEELALWGCNALMVWFDMHHYASLDDPEAAAMIGRLHAILHAAQECGMRPGLLYLANEGFSSTPPAIRVTPGRFQYNVEICPSAPGGLDEIVRLRAQVLDRFSDIDLAFVCIWPHDQGGCGCDACNPWGGRGFVECVRATAPLVRTRFPGARIIASTWCFDRFLKGEFRGFWDALEREPGLADMVMADTHSGFPQFVLDNPVPGGLRVVNFPEISMMGQTPWGGFGANPLAQHIEKTWAPSRAILDGGFPYSEGIFEDLNKAITLQLYWEPARPIESIVREYAESEWPSGFTGELTHAAMRAGERGHIGLVKALEHALFDMPPGEGDPVPRGPADPVFLLPAQPMSDQELTLAARAARGAAAWVQRSWRWRVLHARLELERLARESGGRRLDSADRLFEELSRIYYARNAELPVRPPHSSVVRQLISRLGRTKPDCTVRPLPRPAETTITLKAGEPVVFGPARPDDGELLGRFFEGLSPATRELYSPHAFSRAFARELCADFDGHGMIPFIATGPSRDSVLAYFILYTRVWRGEVERYRRYGIELDEQKDCMFAPVVADAWQNRGLGAALMPRFIAAARELGKRRMILLSGTQRRNARAIRFYEKAGFRLAGYYGDDNFNQDMILDLGGTDAEVRLR